jgi:hypothetical protein
VTAFFATYQAIRKAHASMTRREEPSGPPMIFSERRISDAIDGNLERPRNSPGAKMGNGNAGSGDQP